MALSDGLVLTEAEPKGLLRRLDRHRNPELAAMPSSTLDAYLSRVLALPYLRMRLHVIFWISPQFLGQLFLRLCLLAERKLCALDDHGATYTGKNLMNDAMRLLMWNMPFHTEHHLLPSTPFPCLPAAHAAIPGRIGVLRRGYTCCQVDFARTLRP